MLKRDTVFYISFLFFFRDRGTNQEDLHPMFSGETGRYLKYFAIYRNEKISQTKTSDLTKSKSIYLYCTKVTPE